MPRSLRLLSLTALLFALALAGCDSGDSGGTDRTFDGDVSAILENEAEDVILATYQNLDAEAGDLLTAVQTLEADASQANLEAARDAWRATRVPWEQSESFLFGPVDSEGFDPALDSWPVIVNDLEGVLASGNELTSGFLANQSNGVKGFHTVEFLLFGENGDKPLADVTARELAYLSAAAQVLGNTTEALAGSWSDGFAQTFATAGAQGNTVYASRKAALEDLTGGMFTIANEVRTQKIGAAFSGDDGGASVEDVESRFSRNSLADFQNNVRSIGHLYTGDYDGHSGPGVDEIVRAFDEDLDARMQANLQAAIDALDAIPEPFRTAIQENRPAVQDALDALQELETTIDQPVGSLIAEVQL